MFEINENYEIHPDRSSHEEIWGKKKNLRLINMLAPTLDIQK